VRGLERGAQRRGAWRARARRARGRDHRRTPHALARGWHVRACGRRRTRGAVLLAEPRSGARRGGGYDRRTVSASTDVSTLARNAVHLLPEDGLEEKLRLG